MPRKTVPLVTGEIYHVYNRGVDKRIIAKDKVDYFRFHQSLQLFNAKAQAGSIFELQFKKDWIEKQEPLVHVHAYCILANHFHLLLTQCVDGGISEFMKRLGGGYTAYFNERYGRSGALFQGTFKRVHCETDEQLLYLAMYVNCNNLIHAQPSYALSSIDVYSGDRNENFIDTHLIAGQYKDARSMVTSWRALAAEVASKRRKHKDFEKELFLE